MMTTLHTRSFGITWAALIAVEMFVAGGAVFGGIGLIADSLGMQADWLSGTPFNSWVWPGIFLLLIVAVPMVIAAIDEWSRQPWAYPVSVLAGAALVGWIIAQWLIIGKYFFLQPTMLSAGLLVMLLAWLAHRGEPLRLTRR